MAVGEYCAHKIVFGPGKLLGSFEKRAPVPCVDRSDYSLPKRNASVNVNGEGGDMVRKQWEGDISTAFFGIASLTVIIQ